IFKAFCLFLCAILLFSCFCVAAPDETKQGRIIKDKVNMRDKATVVESPVIYTFSKDTVVTINGKIAGEKVEAGYGDTWYNISYSGKTGYVYGKYIEEIVPNPYDADFEKNILNFPKSYHAKLRKIHEAYPNWVFIADKVNISLDTAIDYEYGSSSLYLTKKCVELTFGIEWRDSRVNIDNTSHILEKRWTYASREAIAYYMDPRNALVVKNKEYSKPNFFTFLQQSYDSKTQTVEGLRTIVANTFLEKGYDGNKDAYINDIMAAAKESGVSPYVIASIIKIEQGVGGTSDLISGKYKGYEGYYNFFNYNAYGENLVKSGLKYAKKKKWKSRKDSIIGGAELYAEGYINKGQDTYYYMDFNVRSEGERQYASSVYDQCVKSVSLSNVCTENKNAAMTFKIPVYTSLPSKVYKAPTIEDYYKQHAEADGDNAETDENSAGNGSENGIDKTGNESGNDSGKDNSKDSGSKDKTESGNSKTENGKSDDGNDSGGTPDSSNNENETKKGDVSGDDKINGRDLAFIKLYLLDLKKLKDEQKNAADINGDGKVNGRDLAIIKMHLLGLREL
ncbi:MAG: SH3 domain-containing protein, partial [Clostridia bacterium]|nr:SH3 domain-containing protein [Clostridia bacterium]